MTPAFAAFVAVLTVIGWGGGEVFGHGVNRYLTRRSVKRWLEAEASWKRYEKRRRVEAGKPPRPPKGGGGIARPGRGPMPKRGVLAESIRNNPSVKAMIEAEIAKHEMFGWQAIGAYNHRVTGERIERYKQTIAPGRVQFTELREDGRIYKQWDEATSVNAGRTGET